MLRRPAPPNVPTVESVDEAITWLDHAIASTVARGTVGGV